MKTLFIEARQKFNKQNSINLYNLPKTLHILYSIQFKELAESIKKQLENKHKILGFEQVLGCSIIKPKAPLLLIGSGRFHASQIAYSTGKPVFLFNRKLEKISQIEINKFKAKEKAKLSRFLLSENIGILISSKPGQNNLKQALALKKKLEHEYQDKKFFLFFSEIINLSELENFQIDLFLNTACPGLELDNNKVLNSDKLKLILNNSAEFSGSFVYF